jgi:hypothetical protein
MAARLRQALRVALITTAGVAAAVLALLLAAPMLVDLPAVRAQLQRKLSEAVNGQIAWDSLQVHWLPSPRGVLHSVRVEIPGRVKVTVERADVVLRLIPLAHGRAEISSITLTRPVIEVEVVASAATPSRGDTGFLAPYRDVVGAVTRSVRQFAPDSVLSIEGARVLVRPAAVPPVELDDLSLRAQTVEQWIDIDITTASSLWRRLHLAGRVAFADLSSQVELEAIEIRLQPWIDQFLAHRSLALALQAADLRARARTDGQTSYHCDVELTAPAIGVTRNQRSLMVSGVAIKGSVVARAQGTQIDVTDLQLGELVPGAKGTLNLARDAQHPDLSIDAARLDLRMIRDAALALAGDVAGIAEYAARIRAGEITGLHMEAKADTWAEVFKPPNIRAGLSLESGVVLVPGLEVEAGGVSARAELANDVIQLERLNAKLGASRLSGGKVSYTLLDRSMRADTAFEIRLAQGLDVARKMLSARVRDQLDLIESGSGTLRGRARAQQAPHADWSASIEVVQSDAAVRLKQVPWPAVLHAARVSASRRQLAVSGLRVSVGRSTIDNAAAQVALEAEPVLKGATAQATLALDELFAVLRAQPQLADALRDVTAVAGSAQIALTRMTGALNRPRGLQYDVTVQPDGLSLEHKQLPERVHVVAGSLRVDPATLTLDRVAVAMLDAQATLSGSIGLDRGQGLQVDALAGDGVVGPTAMKWGWERTGAPARLLLATPLRFTLARARWGQDRNLDLQGALQFRGGQDITVEAAWNPRALEIRRIAIKDQASDATAALTTSKRVLRGRFSGNLDGRSIAAMFEEGREQSGVLDGDFQATFDLDAPRRTTARGRLTARSIDLSHLLARPVQVDRIALEADEQTLRIREAVVTLAQQTATLRGEVKRGERGPIVNGQLELPGIDLDKLLPEESASSGVSGTTSAMQTSAPPQEEGILPRLWPLPLSGQIDVRTPFIQYQEYRVAPIAASVALEARRVQTVLHEAQVCGIAFPLTASITPQDLTLSAQLLAHDQPLADVVRCLTRQEVLMTGRFDLRANLSTHGRRGEFARNLSGSVDAQARDGSTNKFILLAKILSLKPVTDLLQGGEPPEEKEGFPYRQLKVAGRFDSGKFHIDEGAFDSDAIGLATTGAIDLVTHDSALTVLVAPFNRVNRIVRHIPIAGYILGGELVAIAVGVRGDIRDPTVTPLGPQAVTNQLAGILERTLKLPAKLLTPLEPTEQEKEPAAQP